MAVDAYSESVSWLHGDGSWKATCTLHLCTQGKHQLDSVAFFFKDLKLGGGLAGGSEKDCRRRMMVDIIKLHYIHLYFLK